MPSLFLLVGAACAAVAAAQASPSTSPLPSLSPSVSPCVPAAIVTTLAGGGSAGGSASGSANGAGSAATFNLPHGVTMDSGGTVYVADYSNNMLRAISPSGVVTLLAGKLTPGRTDATGASASFRGPFGVAADAFGRVFVGDSGNNVIRVVYTGSGDVATLAGGGGGSTGTASGHADGVGAAATFRNPSGVAVDAAGENVYVADNANNLVRAIALTSSTVTTLAGGGSSGGVAGGYADGAGSNALFSNLYGVTVGASGTTVFVGDRDNNLVRAIAVASGAVTTLAGGGSLGGTAGGYLDATGSAALFSLPEGMAADLAGNLFVTDNNNQRVRAIVIATGVVTTLAGATGGGRADGVGTLTSQASTFRRTSCSIQQATHLSSPTASTISSAQWP